MLFSRKSKYEYIDRPLAGRLIPMEQVKDAGFAQKMMGEGFAVIPEENIVCAPISGTVILTEMKHAFCISGEQGEELIVHVGVDTVHLQRDVFERRVESGSYVTAGTPILGFDREEIVREGFDSSVIVAFSNWEDYELDSRMMQDRRHVLRYTLKAK